MESVLREEWLCLPLHDECFVYKKNKRWYYNRVPTHKIHKWYCIHCHSYETSCQREGLGPTTMWLPWLAHKLLARVPVTTKDKRHNLSNYINIKYVVQSIIISLCYNFHESYNTQEKQDQWHSTTQNTSNHYISCCSLCAWEATHHNATTNTLKHYDIGWNCSQWLCIIWNTSSHSLRTNG